MNKNPPIKKPAALASYIESLPHACWSVYFHSQRKDGTESVLVGLKLFRN